MRKRKRQHVTSRFKLIAVDDEIGILETLSVVFKQAGYNITTVNHPYEAIELIKNEHFDILILDYLMSPIHGDKVVETIRQFNKEIYILLLTGHKDIAPPLETIKALDIQAYCEKNDRFDQLLLLVESGIKSILQMETIKTFKDGLNKILSSVPKIYQLQPIGNILEEILTEILPFVNSENAFILVDNLGVDNTKDKSIFKGIGKFNIGIEEFMGLLDTNFMEEIGICRTSKKLKILEKGIIIPLINEYTKSIGVIFVECETDNQQEMMEGIKLLEIYTGHAAAAVSNAFLHSMLNMKNEELKSTYEELKKRYIDTIEALRQVVDCKDMYTRGHSDRVSFYSYKIGEAFNVSKEDLETLKIAGLFHDIGKVGITDDILLKTDRLNSDEYEQIKKHPTKGANILSAVSMFKEVVEIVKCHHERIDGKGYPEGISGDAIPFLARIVSVADAFDAMMSDRLYRSKLDLDEAKSQLIQGSGTQFDGEVVKVFIKLLDDYDIMLKELSHTF